MVDYSNKKCEIRAEPSKIDHGFINVIEGLYEKLEEQKAYFEKCMEEGFEEAYQIILVKEEAIKTLRAELDALKGTQHTIEPVWGKMGEWSLYNNQLIGDHIPEDRLNTRPIKSIPFVSTD